MVRWIAPPDGAVTPRSVANYAVVRGPGLVIVEATTVAPEGRLSADQLGVFDDRQVEGLRALADVIRAEGAVSALQIHHAGRNTRTHASFFGNGLLAPSAINPGGETPRELSEPDIERILQDFAAAARRAMDAGFDAVELHAAHGFLFSQFLSPLSNRRRDRWGGSLENRARFLLEAVQRVRRETGGGIHCWCRFGPVDGEAGGLTLEEGLEVARWLKSVGMPLLHVSEGMGGCPPLAPEGSPWCSRVHLAATVREAVGIPVICVGEIRRPEEAERALSEGMADLVAVGRGMLADPTWAQKARIGEAHRIYLCQGCAKCSHFTDPDAYPERRQERRHRTEARKAG